MSKHIYNLLSFIKINNSIPLPDDLKTDKATLISIVKRCLSDELLDKKILYVNILGEVQCDESPELAITIKGYSYLEENNPVGKLI